MYSKGFVQSQTEMGWKMAYIRPLFWALLSSYTKPLASYLAVYITSNLLSS